jgi:hypothetical protein
MLILVCGFNFVYIRLVSILIVYAFICDIYLGQSRLPISSDVSLVLTSFHIDLRFRPLLYPWRHPFILLTAFHGWRRVSIGRFTYSLMFTGSSSFTVNFVNTNTHTKLNEKNA